MADEMEDTGEPRRLRGEVEKSIVPAQCIRLLKTQKLGSSARDLMVDP
jgi:hypothetical protein